MQRLLRGLIVFALAAGTAVVGAVAAVPASALRDLRELYLRERAAVETAHRERLGALVDTNLARAGDMLREARVSGNITATAVARKANAIFEACRKDLDAGREPRLPGRVRRELKSMVDAFAAAVKTSEQDAARERAGLEEAFLQRLSVLLRDAGETPGSREQLKARFEALLASAPPPDVEPVAEPVTEPAGGGAGADDGGAEGTDRPPTVLASSGTAGEWVTFANWYAAVSGLEVLKIPVMNRREREESRGRSLVSGKRFVARYDPVRALSPGQAQAFRIVSMRYRYGAEVLDWPSAGNGWVLQLRVRPRGTLPSQHGLALQAGFPGAGAMPRLDSAGDEPREPAPPGAGVDPGADAAPAPAGGVVPLSIKTEPAGAAVEVNGRTCREGGAPVRTPCVVEVPAGGASIRLTRFGYVPAQWEHYKARSDTPLVWRFERDTRIVDHRTMVSASAPWRYSGVAVKKGDRVFVSASGRWSCGEGGEMTGPDGYPNAARYAHYYRTARSAPRQLTAEPYGMLLLRIGKDGPLGPAGSSRRLTADREGFLYLDINELPGAVRRDNTGSLTVRIVVAPGDGADAGP